MINHDNFFKQENDPRTEAEKQDEAALYGLSASKYEKLSNTSLEDFLTEVVDDITEPDIMDETQQTESDNTSRTERFSGFWYEEEIRYYGKSKNHANTAHPRNEFHHMISQMFKQATDHDMVLFREQLTYIAVSWGIHIGDIQPLQTERPNCKTIIFNEDMYLAAIYGVPSIVRKIAEHLGKAPQELRFPEAVRQHRKVLNDIIERRTFKVQNDNPSRDWFTIAAVQQEKLKPSKDLFSLFRYIFKAVDNKVTSLAFDYKNLALLFQNKLDVINQSNIGAQLGNMNQEKPSIFKKQRKAQQISQFCEHRVKGQKQAISAITEMVNGAFVSKRVGLAGITTFMGASGTGKTVLAETYVDALNAVYDADYQIIVLNMEMFSDKHSTMKLFGSGSQYSDSWLGQLTTQVLVHPRTVFVIDEIEKANPAVIQSFLTLFEKGVARDLTTNMLVDFSQCFVIVTTNLGHKAATQTMSKNKQLDLVALLSEGSKKVGLSPEMISRLSRGSLALFRPLEARELFQVAEYAAKLALQDKTICWQGNLPIILIETLGGDLHPRAIQSQAAKIKNKILELVAPQCSETENDPVIMVEITEDISEFHFVMVTEDPTLTQILQKHFNRCQVITDLTQLDQVTMNKNVQAVLLHEPQSTGELNSVNQGKTPYYSIGGQNNSLITNTNALPIERHYELTDITIKSLTTIVQHMAKHSRLLNTVDQLSKRKMAIEFNYQLSIIGDVIKVTLQNPIYEQRFASDDFEPVYMQAPCIPKTTFKDLIGQDELKAQMSFILARLRGDNDYVLDMPKGYLLTGKPGTGKSYFAKAVAGECQVPFIPVNAADLMMGDVVNNINHLFDVAERYAPCIVFLDEIDAIAIDREQSSFHGRLAVNTLLTRLDGFLNGEHLVFVMAATNFAHKLDPAIVRHGRFDKTVTIPLPDTTARKHFIAQCCAKYGFELNELASLSLAKRLSGVTYGFIETLFRDVQLTLLTKQCQFSARILNDQLLSAALGNKKTTSSFNNNDRLIVAYHETGHYLLHKHWHPNVKCTNLSIQEHERADGVAMFDFDDREISQTKAIYKARLQTLLAGRAAEKLFSNNADDITPGASHDIQQATLLAKHAISVLGYSDSLGLADFKQLPMLQEKVENEVVEWLNAAYSASEAYLRDNWHLVKHIAEILFEQESLDQTQLDDIMLNQNRTAPQYNH